MVDREGRTVQSVNVCVLFVWLRADPNHHSPAVRSRTVGATTVSFLLCYEGLMPKKPVLWTCISVTACWQNFSAGMASSPTEIVLSGGKAVGDEKFWRSRAAERSRRVSHQKNLQGGAK